MKQKLAKNTVYDLLIVEFETLSIETGIAIIGPFTTWHTRQTSINKFLLVRDHN